MAYKVEGFLYGSPYEHDLEYDTLKEAVAACYWAIEDNQFMPLRIMCPDGQVIARERIGLGRFEGELSGLLAEYDKKLHQPIPTYRSGH